MKMVGVDEEDLLFVYCQLTRNYFHPVSHVTRSLVPYFPSKSLITTEAQKMPKAAGR